jgi:hypothetical protein
MKTEHTPRSHRVRAIRRRVVAAVLTLTLVQGFP